MSSWLQNLLTILGVVSTVALVVAFFKTDVTKRNVENLTSLVETLEKRVIALETEREEMAEKIKHLDEENDILRSLLDGSKGTAELQEKIDKNHLEILQLLERTMDKFEKLLSQK